MALGRAAAGAWLTGLVIHAVVCGESQAKVL